MSPDLQQQLKAKYPALLQWLNGGFMTSMVGDYGIQCGDGWLSIIDDLCGALQAGVDVGRFRQPIVSQITQEHGRLRVEVANVANEARTEVDALLATAKERSATACEICGAPALLRWQHGVQTVCDAHAEPRSRVFKEGDIERVLAARRATREARRKL